MKVWRGDNCIRDMLAYLKSYNLGRNIVIAHNAAGYDTRLVYQAAAKCGIRDCKMTPILQGSKFIELSIGKLIFRDSMLHLKGSLADLGRISVLQHQLKIAMAVKMTKMKIQGLKKALLSR